MQDDEPYDVPAPSLVGLWDNFPLLHSGAGGFDVDAETQTAVARHPFALRRVFALGVESRADGGMHELTEAEQNDLIAYLLML
jgi:hypothetical protein